MIQGKGFVKTVLSDEPEGSSNGAADSTEVLALQKQVAELSQQVEALSRWQPPTMPRVSSRTSTYSLSGWYSCSTQKFVS